MRAATRLAEGNSVGTVAEGATAQACYAALLLLEGARNGDVKTLERAVAVYQGTLILGDGARQPRLRAEGKRCRRAHVAEVMAAQ